MGVKNHHECKNSGIVCGRCRCSVCGIVFFICLAVCACARNIDTGSETGIRHCPSDPDSPVAQALPALDGSDEFAMNELIALVGQPFVQKHLVPQNLIRNLVVTIDNLPRKKVAGTKNPVVPITGQIDDQSDATTAMTPDQYARYDEFVQTVAAVDSKQLVATYFKLYPLFQDAVQITGLSQRLFQ